jgi:hypothetical protein
MHSKIVFGEILGKSYPEDLGYGERFYKPTLEGDV